MFENIPEDELHILAVYYAKEAFKALKSDKID